ncbi:MAG: type VI secretion system baseplate subunit TssK [Pseudomonadota bacterium]|nr:type VI secretion system baseplate subunit TssK [Pseudomonadota bacterium]
MPTTNQIIWSEGMFLRPQHFQQQTRYFEALIHDRSTAGRAYPWGIRQFELDRPMLGLGKLAIARATGVFSDGTAFRFPENDLAPPPLVVPSDTKNARVFLAVPLKGAHHPEVARGQDADALARLLAREVDVSDLTDQDGKLAQVAASVPHLQLRLDGENLSGYTTIPIARIIEVRADGSVVIDDDFIPSVLDVGAVPRLSGFVSELMGLLQHRAEAIVARLNAGGQSFTELADFLLLQLINREEMLLRHLGQLPDLHPEFLYRELAQMGGELATFASETRRPGSYHRYQHDDLNTSFDGLMQILRQYLSSVFEQSAVAIELDARKYGIRVATVTDTSLLESADFILAVSADVPPEQVRARLPAQLKVGPVEKIRQLVNLQLPGIRLRALPVAPRQLPYYAGYTYFELDRSGEFWQQLRQSGGIAFHVAGDFPGLKMEFWAVRGKA